MSLSNPSVGSRSRFKTSKSKRTQNKRRSFGKIRKQARQPIQSSPPSSPPSSPLRSKSKSKSKSHSNILTLIEFGHEGEHSEEDVSDLVAFIESEKAAAAYCCFRNEKDLVSHIRAAAPRSRLNTATFDPTGDGYEFLINLIDKIYESGEGGRITGNTGSRNDILSNYIRLHDQYKSRERPNKYDIRAQKSDVVVFAILTKDLIDGRKHGGNKYRNKKYKRKHYTNKRKHYTNKRKFKK